jgi:hypothetical protein
LALYGGGLDELVIDLALNIVTLLRQRINADWETGHMSDQWMEGTIAPIWKAGDKTDVRSYRGICVQRVAAKVYSNILARLRRRLDLKFNMGFIMAGVVPMLSLYCVES